MTGDRARYVYTDEDDQPIAFKERVERPDGGKAFYPHHRDDAGTVTHDGVGFSSGLPTPELKAALYRLPEFVRVLGANRKSSRVFWTEGERDADSVAAQGEMATTVLQSGAEHVARAAQRFAGFRGVVVVVADRDPSGYAQALCKRDALQAVGVQVLVKEPRGTHNDLTDHLSAGLTLNQLVPVLNLEDKARQHNPTQPGNGSFWPGAAAAQTPEPPAPTEERFAKAVAAERERLEVRAEAQAQFAAADWCPPGDEGSLAEQLAAPPEPMRWLVQDLAFVGANVLVTATAKAGKTVLMVNVMRCLLGGDELFGRFAVEKLAQDRAVAWWNAELTRAQAISWMRKHDFHVGAERLHPLHLRGWDMPLSSRRVEDWAVRWLQERAVSVWIIDPKSALFDGEENSSTENAAWLKALDRIKRRAGVETLFLVHHASADADPDDADDRSAQILRPRGSTRLVGWADVLWSYTGSGREPRYLSALGRDVDVQPFGGLFMSADTRTLIWDGRDGTRTQNRADEDAERVYTIVRAQAPDPVKTKDIDDQLPGKKRDRWIRARQAALAKGYVVSAAGPRNSTLWTVGPKSPFHRKLHLVNEE